MASSESANRRLLFRNSPPNFLAAYNQRPGDMTNRLNASGYGSHFTFSGGPFLPPSSTQLTNTNSSLTDSPRTFGSILPQQQRYKSPPQPTGNLDTRLPIIPTPPPLQSSTIASIRQTYATSTPGTNRHTSNELVTHSNSAQHAHPHHHHHAPAVHSPLSDAGPPFTPTESLHRLYLPGTMAGSVTLSIHPKVDRGFFLAAEDNEWTCYRRNYFQISVAYSVSSPNPNMANEGLMTAGIMLDYHGRQERVTGFKLTIGARVYGSDAKVIDLVQHTPKRDKGPQLKPALNLMTPGGDVERHGHHDISDSADDEKAALSGNIQEGEAPKVVTYERIQFKQATANNGKRRAAQQYFSLIVEAYATVLGAQGEEDIRVAVTKSSPVVVRGRSPGHYSDTPPAEVKSRPAELTTSTSFLRNEQPSPTQTPTRPVANTAPGESSSSALPQTSVPSLTTNNNESQNTANNRGNLASNDLNFLASLDADFNGYQYLPFTLLDPQGKMVVPHDLFYDPHEFPDSHYANLLFGTGDNTQPNLSQTHHAVSTADPFPAQGTGLSGEASQQGQGATQQSEFSNLYQGFFDFPVQEITNWNNTMGRGNSQQGGTTTTVAAKTEDAWFDSFPSNSASQSVVPGFRGNSNHAGNGGSSQSQQTFSFGFPGASQDGNGGNGNGGAMTPGGKWMFEFRNSSYGYFPNLPAIGEMPSTSTSQAQ